MSDAAWAKAPLPVGTTAGGYVLTTTGWVLDPYGQIAYDLAQRAVPRVVEALTTPPTVMPGRSQRRRRRRQRQRRRANAAFKITRFNVKHVFLWKDFNGDHGKFWLKINLSTLVYPYSFAFDEFRVSRIRCVYKPNNAVSETGLYAAVLLDGAGFGSYGTGTEAGWFRSLATFPGSRIQPRHLPVGLVWYPTEPSDREWLRFVDDKNTILCSVWFCDNGMETAELGGVLEVTASIQARGLYWNASVRARQRRHLSMLMSGACETGVTPKLSDLEFSTGSEDNVMPSPSIDVSTKV